MPKRAGGKTPERESTSKSDRMPNQTAPNLDREAARVRSFIDLDDPGTVTQLIERQRARDDAIRTKIEQRRSEGIEQAHHIRNVANVRLAKLDLSRKSRVERSDPAFVTLDEDVIAKQKNIQIADLEAIKEHDQKAGLTVTLSEHQAEKAGLKMIVGEDSGTLIARSFPSLVEAAISSPELSKRDIHLACFAEARADELLESAPSGDEAPSPEGDVNKLQTNQGHVETNAEKPGSSLIAEQIIALLDGGATQDGVDDLKSCRATVHDIDQAASSLALHSGPADQESFHDFFDLQIAFRSVWSEFLDEKIIRGAKTLYEECLKLKMFEGGDEDESAPTTAGELKELYDDYQRYMHINTEQDSRFASVQIYLSDCNADDWVLMDENTKSTLFALYLEVQNFKEIFYDDPTLFAFWSDEKREKMREILAASRSKKPKLALIMEDLRKRLTEPYAFDIFCPGTVNFGIIVNYRQRWSPVKYQIGELVSTIPLAPKEVRRFSKKRVVRQTRARKEVENSSATRKFDLAETSRAHAEIVRQARVKSNFQLNTQGSLSFEIASISAQSQLGIEAEHRSRQQSKSFRESVTKAAQEYKNDHRLEISSTSAEEYEESSSGEISNPNDEIPVTYLFYELQQRYMVSEKIHKLSPVILVANDVPNPAEIDEDWLIQYAWILKRVLRDDYYEQALQYLLEDFTGDEISTQALRVAWYTQLKLVSEIKEDIKAAETALGAVRGKLAEMVELGASRAASPKIPLFAKISLPFLGGPEPGSKEEATEIEREAAQNELERLERTERELRSRLTGQTSALDQATSKYTQRVQEQFNRRAQILGLRAHVKQNILYYMQAIWDYEPPDQRYFRLYNLTVPVFDPSQEDIPVHRAPPAADNPQSHRAPPTPDLRVEGRVPPPSLSDKTQRLVDIADIDNLLGYKGNYMIFPLKKNNPLTLYMSQDYIEIDKELRALLKDPDPMNNLSVEELVKYAKCRQAKGEFPEEEREHIRGLLIERLNDPSGPMEEILIPTDSLYIEALPGAHPILEDFKLVHRAVDVKQAQAEVRHQEFENVRLAARILKGKLDDPDVEKKIFVTSENDKGNIVVNDT